MRITPDRLAVGHAVWNAAKEFFAAPDTAPLVDLDEVIEALPEPEPQPAPTHPGLWWTKRVGSPWFPCEVYRDGEFLIVYTIGNDMDEVVGDFDAWLPLTPPEVEP